MDRIYKEKKLIAFFNYKFLSFILSIVIHYYQEIAT